MDKIDKVVNKLLDPYAKIQDALITIGVNASKKNLTLDDLAELDFTGIVLDDLGGAELVGAVTEASGAIATAKNPNINAVIASLDDQFFINQLTDAGAKVKQVIADSIIHEYTEGKLRELLKEATNGMSAGKVETLLQTSMRTTEATAYFEILKDLPDDAKVLYDGPADAKNRPFCAALVGKTISVSELKTLLNDDGQPAATARGGYNCRHDWVAV